MQLVYKYPNSILLLVSTRCILGNLERRLFRKDESLYVQIACKQTHSFGVSREYLDGGARRSCDLQAGEENGAEET